MKVPEFGRPVIHEQGDKLEPLPTWGGLKDAALSVP
ncbi:hypothetical protein NHJ6243_002183, partial [Beauveria neobassiana]